ncbi:MAG: glycoside hydrolase family 1 protein [Patescibacteria group bacterium]
MSLKFPDNFLFGAATSSYQVEGNNVNSDWWVWEETHAGLKGGPKEKSGIACDSYNRYEEDFELAKNMNHTVQRVSIEWSRIEPEEGVFNEAEIEHYAKVLDAIRSRGMKTFVTLWHFTNPKWFRDNKGWGNLKAPHYFARYSKYIAQKLGDKIDYFSTLNEPVVYITLRHLLRTWMPQKHTSILDFFDGWIGLLRGHFASYKAIKSVNENYIVGIVENVMCIEPYEETFLNRLICRIRKYLQYEIFLTLVARKTDFFGVNYYFHDVVTPQDIFINQRSIETATERNDWGWEIYPEGIYHVVKEVAKFKKPIYITENGLADAKDEKREGFIVRHLYWVHKAISEGCDIRGYMHWSLLDNFEWAEGYRWKFGLIEVDRNTLERKVRPSAKTYAEICKTNEVLDELVDKYIVS